jgi:DNA polymerase-4
MLRAFRVSDFTASIERISIDEALADVAGARISFGSPAEIARTIRARVRTELGLPMSIGVARTTLPLCRPRRAARPGSAMPAA